MHSYNTLNQKKLEERIITKSIFNSINNNQNLDLYGISYNQYLKISNLDNVMTHFGNNLTNDDFKNILNNILNNFKINNNDSNNFSQENSYNKQLSYKTSASAIYSGE